MSDPSADLADDTLKNIKNESITTEQASINQTFQISSDSFVEWADGLSNEEIYRLPIDTDEKFILKRIALMVKGGGTNSNITLEVYNDTTSSSIDSINGGEISTAGGETSDGDTVILRLSNSDGTSVIACYFIEGYIR